MIRAAHNWPSNAEMIADVGKLGYIHGNVCDPTYGEGVFWKKFTDFEALYLSDIKMNPPVDFRSLPYSDNMMDTVVFDPPYKLNGTPSEPDVRYGVDKKATVDERMMLCYDGGIECIRVLKVGGHLLWKMMDQVVSGEIVWQTRHFADFSERNGMKLVDRFDFLHEPRKQPAGRKQVHAARCYSTLLVLKKVR